MAQMVKKLPANKETRVCSLDWDDPLEKGISVLVCYELNALVGTCMLSHFSCVDSFVTLWTMACQAPLSMGFSRQECWSGLPCPPPGHLPNPGIKPCLLCLLHWKRVRYHL